MLSRKHYVSIAKIINENTCEVEDTTWKVLDKDTLIDDLCKVFARDNNLFDTARFRRACDGV
jgi:hypothetical protein